MVQPLAPLPATAVMQGTSWKVTILEPVRAMDSGAVESHPAHVSLPFILYLCYTVCNNYDAINWLTVIDCGAPEIPQNGRISTPEGTTVGSKALYFCNDGYVLFGAEFRTCQENGQWFPGVPICRRK